MAVCKSFFTELCSVTVIQLQFVWSRVPRPQANELIMNLRESLHSADAEAGAAELFIKSYCPAALKKLQFSVRKWRSMNF